MKENTQQKFLTVKEVSELFRIPLSSVYRLVKNGELRSVRLGRHVRIFQSDVERLCTSSLREEVMS